LREKLLAYLMEAAQKGKLRHQYFIGSPIVAMTRRFEKCIFSYDPEALEAPPHMGQHLLETYLRLVPLCDMVPIRRRHEAARAIDYTALLAIIA
jgi:hypothetical protein